MKRTESQRRYYERNRERLRTQMRDYYYAHRTRIKAANLTYYYMKKKERAAESA
jgi:hypothetical protein